MLETEDVLGLDTALEVDETTEVCAEVCGVLEAEEALELEGTLEVDETAEV